VVASYYPKPNGKPGKEIKQASLLITIPAIMFAAPAVGYFIGFWADKKLGTDPYLSIVGVIFGFVAAGVEVYRLIKRSSALEDSDKRNENGS
jgi:F0F1-type ATP synthase assembly protein I